MKPIAAEHGVSVARVALAWLLHKPHVTSVIIGAKTKEQLLDNLAATELKLTDQEMAKLDQVSALDDGTAEHGPLRLPQREIAARQIRSQSEGKSIPATFAACGSRLAEVM